MGEFTLVLKDVVTLMMLPMFGETNAMGVVLEVEDEMKLKYLTFSMTASRTSDKSSYATSLASSAREVTVEVATSWRLCLHTGYRGLCSRATRNMASTNMSSP